MVPEEDTFVSQYEPIYKRWSLSRPSVCMQIAYVLPKLYASDQVIFVLCKGEPPFSRISSVQAMHSVKFSARQNMPRPLCTKSFVNSDLMTMLARMDSSPREAKGQGEAG